LTDVAQAGQRNCASPPATFAPDTASDRDIAYYGLPPRPADPHERSEWKRAVGNAKYRWCQTFTTPSQDAPPHLTNAQHLINTAYTASSDNWGGYIADDGGSVTYNGARGWFNLKCASSSPYHASAWVGVGGANGDALWQAGWDSAAHVLWWEAVGSPGDQHFTTHGQQNWVPTGGTPQCGDNGYAVVLAGEPNNYYAFAEDTTSGGYGSETWAPNVYRSFYSGDWIVERPACGVIPDGSLALYQWAKSLPDVYWSDGDYWYDYHSGYLYPLGYNINYQITITNGPGGQSLLTTSYLSPDGNGQYRLFHTHSTGASSTYNNECGS
jgi:hypothetical protein